MKDRFEKQRAILVARESERKARREALAQLARGAFRSVPAGPFGSRGKR